MKFTVKKSDLQAALAPVKRIASGRAVYPILQGVLVETIDTGIMLSATDLEMTVRIRVDAQVEQNGSTVLPAARLGDLVGKVDGDLRFEQEEQKMVVRFGKNRASMMAYSVADYPALPEVAGTSITVPALVWKQATQRVIIAAASESIKPNYAGMMLKATESNLTLAATDTYRLAEEVLEIESQGDLGECPQIVIPAKALREVNGLLDGSLPLRITWDVEKSVKFETDRFLLTARQMDQPFPNYRKVIPPLSGQPLILKRDEFAATLSRGMLYPVTYSDASEKHIVNAVMKMDVRENQVTIDVENQDGDLHETFDLTEPALEIKQVFTVSYMLTPLKFMDDTVRLHMTEGEPAVFREDGYSYLIIPLRVAITDEPRG